MVSKFLQSSNKLLLHNGDGEIHITHKTKPPYNQWNIQSLHKDNGIDDGNKNQIEFKGRIVFDKTCFMPYTPRKALDKKSFTCHDACVYVFGYKKEQRTLNFPSSIPLQDTKKDDSDDDVLHDITLVTKDVLSLVRSKHLELFSKRYSPFSINSKNTGGKIKPRRKRRRKR